MTLQNKKCVLVVDETLPVGLIANTAAILGFSLGRRHPELTGPDVMDAAGQIHPGIIEIPVPVLRGQSETIRAIRNRISEPDFQDVTMIDFFDLAQSCLTYEDYMEKISHADEQDLQYFGIGLCGPKKKISRLTGSLPLLR